MSSNNKKKKSNWKNNENKSSENKGNDNKNIKKKVLNECPICGKNVRDLLTAIAVTDDLKPAHFDCAIAKIAETEDLQPKEKIVYLGKGSFGIVKYRASGPMKFFVRKRIQFEKNDIQLDWRNRFSNKIKKQVS